MILVIFIIGFLVFGLGKLALEEILKSDNPKLTAQIMGVIILVVAIAVFIAR